MDYPIKDIPAFSPTMRKLEQDDPGNAGIFNPLFEALLDNDNHLRQEAENITAITPEEIDELDNTSSGG